ncbi:MAG: pyridoxamine 5'-phosphate oxidase family protein [Clostridiales Family XIII bacterium]|jgi:general stress protein 26|nr:pyridoxamine 5'-phosphate oxidase family protein [Clostridiales Family XIII bacterium]
MSKMESIPYETAMQTVWYKLGKSKIMALAACTKYKPSVRNVSAIIQDNRILFKTDIHFDKTKQILENPNVAIAHWGVSIEGQAVNLGSLINADDFINEKPDSEIKHAFASAYKTHWDKSYTAYAHKDTEILIEVVPESIEIWDQDENDKAFQTLIDCANLEAHIVRYD